MSFFKDLFGGTDKSAQKKQIKSNEESRQFTRDMLAQGRQDLFGMFPVADDNRNMGFQAGFDVLGQTIPGQMDVFQQGNIGAQNAYLAGMPQFQNAVLGMPVNYNAFQPFQIDYDTSWAQQTLPGYQSYAPAETTNDPGQEPSWRERMYGAGAALAGSYRPRSTRV